jgi:formylglycine-generating enzyme required for sulfatase activity
MAIIRSKLGKLGLAILEGFVGRQLGQGFVDELRSDYKIHDNLICALERTEEIFRKTCGDKDFTRAIFDDLPITSLPSLQDVVRGFYNNPSDPAFLEVLKEILNRDLKQFASADIEKYTSDYMYTLTQQLAVLDEKFNIKISTLTNLASLGVAKETLKAVERVAGNTTTREGGNALNVYLDYVIESHHLLKLHGIYFANEVIGIELNKVYIPQYVMRAKSLKQEDALINRLGKQIPGYSQQVDDEDQLIETETISLVDQALAQYPRLVVLGSPGTGKSTLLSYLALHHGMNLRCQEPAKKKEVCLPIFCALRDLAKYLPENESDGPDILLNFIQQYVSSQQIEDFEKIFGPWLNDEKLCCLLLLDGMDEVGDERTRARISRIIEKFTLRYPHNRYVVTSRIAGYRRSSRLGEGYKVVTLHPFNDSDMREFVINCNRQIELFLRGSEDQSALNQADVQSEDLLNTIFANQKLIELASIPLLSMIILLVYRDRGTLPDKRVKIYEAIVDVLLSQWDEAKGIKNVQYPYEHQLDNRDMLLVLEKIAFDMHSQKIREVNRRQLSNQLIRQFQELGSTPEKARWDAQDYIRVMQERTGLLQERGQDIYSFAHLSMQEYLTASVLSSRDDLFTIVQKNLTDSWWHEVIKMAISLMAPSHKTKLLEAILESPQEVDRYDNLLITAECIADLELSQIPHSLQVTVQERLLQAMVDGSVGLEKRIAVSEILGKISDPRFRGQFILPAFAKISSGPFNKGSKPENLYALENEIPQISVETQEFFISIYPVTNAQYQYFILENSDFRVPHSNFYPVSDWDQNLRVCRPSRRNRPVVFVSRDDANQYCRWLTQRIETDQSLPYEIRNHIKNGWVVRLPTESEWEKAARGPQGMEWPWGNKYQLHLVNSEEEGIEDTTPVGIFHQGASTFGVYDMAGNVFEWTQDSAKPEGVCALKGGAWNYDYINTRCAYRLLVSPANRTSYIGFRIAIGLPIEGGSTHE